MGCVYSISCPINKVVVYIGQTNCTFESRMIAHYKHPSNPGMKIFMADLKVKGLYPVCQILEDNINEKDLTGYEKKWIDLHLSKGVKLFNRKHGKPVQHDFKLITDFSQIVTRTA